MWGIMTYLSDEKLNLLDGGETITGTLVTALTSGVKALFDVGRSLGSSVRRLSSDEICPL